MGAPEHPVRLATLEEAPVVREIMRAAFAEYERALEVPSSALLETVEDVVAHMRLGGAVLVTAGRDALVGSGRFERRDGYVYIGRLAVLPAHRGLGLAAAMIGFIETIARAEGASEARLSLPRNIDLYRRLGYAVTATYPHPRGPEFVADMAKTLIPT